MISGHQKYQLYVKSFGYLFRIFPFFCQSVHFARQVLATSLSMVMWWEWERLLGNDKTHSKKCFVLKKRFKFPQYVPHINRNIVSWYTARYFINRKRQKDLKYLNCFTAATFGYLPYKPNNLHSHFDGKPYQNIRMSKLKATESIFSAVNDF